MSEPDQGSAPEGFTPHPGRVLGVFKFGTRDRMEQFSQGLLYMNTLQYFAKLETDMLRTDSHEGTSHLLRGDGAILSIKSGEKFVPVGEIKGPIRYKPDALKNVNVFCMYALRESLSDCLVSPKNFDFGDTFAVLTDFQEFLRRASAAAPGTGQQLEWDLVEYIDESSHLGPVGIFRKARVFSYQSSFAWHCFQEMACRCHFTSGILSDIVRLGPLSELNGRLKVQRITPQALGSSGAQI